MAVDIDEILVAIGEVGPYQRRVYFLLCLPIIFVGAASLSYVFIAATPHYRCVVPGCDSDKGPPTYEEPFLNFSTPWDNQTEEYCTCRQYRRKPDDNLYSCMEDDFTDEIEQCESGILFDTSIYKSTVVTEFNLTCSSSWQASMDQSIYFAGMLFGSFIFGICSDVFGRRKTILVGVVLMSVTGVAIALVPNLASFHVLRFLNALGSCGLFQTLFILGLEFVGPGKRVMFGVVGEYFFAGGQVFLGLVAWGVPSWRMLQLIISSPVICFTFYYWVIPESVRWLQAKGRHIQVLASLENIAKINRKTIPLNLLRHQPVLIDEDADETDDLAVLISRHQKVSLMDLLRSPVMALRMLFMILIWVATTLTYYGLSFNATELGAGSGTNKPFVNFILSALVEVPGYTWAWIGMQYWGRKWSLMTSLFLSGSACIAAAYIKGYVSSLLVFLLGKCSITCAFAIVYIFTAEMFPTSVRNSVVGTCSMFGRVGGMLAPFSTTLRTFYLPLPMLVFGSLSLLSSLLTLVMPETLNTKLPDTIFAALNLGKEVPLTPEEESVSAALHPEEDEALLEASRHPSLEPPEQEEGSPDAEPLT